MSRRTNFLSQVYSQEFFQVFSFFVDFCSNIVAPNNWHCCFVLPLAMHFLHCNILSVHGFIHRADSTDIQIQYLQFFLFDSFYVLFSKFTFFCELAFKITKFSESSFCRIHSEVSVCSLYPRFIRSFIYCNVSVGSCIINLWWLATELL